MHGKYLLLWFLSLYNIFTSDWDIWQFVYCSSAVSRNEFYTLLDTHVLISPCDIFSSSEILIKILTTSKSKAKLTFVSIHSSLLPQDYYYYCLCTCRNYKALNRAAGNICHANGNNCIYRKKNPSRSHLTSYRSHNTWAHMFSHIFATRRNEMCRFALSFIRRPLCRWMHPTQP